MLYLRKLLVRTLALWIAAGLLPLVTGASESVEFRSLDKQLAKPLVGQLSKPTGPGPFAAIVLLHGCGGMGHARDADWATRLNEWGFLTLRVDSLGARGQTSVCDNVYRVTRFQRAQDAHGALAYLAGRPDVARDRIGVIGWSHGAWAVLTVVDNDPAIDAWPGRFRAAVAFYPQCLESLTGLGTSVLTLVGERDTWTPAQRCRQMQLKGGDRSMFELKAYPDAAHGFDHDAPARVIMGHRIAFDPAAAADAIPRVKAFFEKHLQ